MHKTRLLWKAGVIAIVLALLMVGVVYAITIVVDGDREAAWSGSGGQTPGSAPDGNELGINDNVDMETFQWTNDTTNFYFLVDVYASAPLMPPLAVIDICLDTSPSTDIPSTNTIQRNRCSYGTGVTGIDTVVEAYRLNNGTKIVDVYDVTTDPPTFTGSGVLGYNPAATTPVVEMSVPLSLLGFNSGNCPSSIRTVVYYDGGDTNPDDNLPDSGSININCGGPTAITLSSLSAMSETGNSTSLILLTVAVLGLGTLGFVTIRRRRTHSL